MIFEIFQSATFSQWLSGLRDRNARVRIQARIDRIATGNLGDVAPIGEGLSEARIFYGPGYRLYFRQQGKVVIVLLCGGDKSTQPRDIEQAKEIAREWEGQQDE